MRWPNDEFGTGFDAECAAGDLAIAMPARIMHAVMNPDGRTTRLTTTTTTRRGAASSL